MSDQDRKPGRIFVAPLLQGGYAFGYLTYYNKSLMTLVDVFDFWSKSPTPPGDLSDKPVILHDLIVGAEFLLTPKHHAGERWKVLKESMPGPVAPRNRYYRMGGPPRSFRRIDILKEEPDVPLSPAEAEKYPPVRASFPPVPTARVEVAVKHLTVSPDQLIDAWEGSNPQ